MCYIRKDDDSHGISLNSKEINQSYNNKLIYKHDDVNCYKSERVGIHLYLLWLVNVQWTKSWKAFGASRTLRETSKVSCCPTQKIDSQHISRRFNLITTYGVRSLLFITLVGLNMKNVIPSVDIEWLRYLDIFNTLHLLVWSTI